MAKIGIIGGSGLDNPNFFQPLSKTKVSTPYGSPSSELTTGIIQGVEIVILSRHGVKHQFSPSEVNYRANIYAMKECGVDCIIATTACGSLREEIERGHLVIIDQFIDFTRKRANTFFENFADGATHTSMAEPFDKRISEILYLTAKNLGYNVHSKGTVITIEGPRFSSKAESKMFRTWGADIINMSVATEAILANELKIPYAAVAMSTDYDCWKEDEKPVSWEEILHVFHKNADNVKNLLLNVIPKI